MAQNASSEEALPSYDEGATEERIDYSSAVEQVRVLIIAASLDILGGQAVQAQRLVSRLKQEPSLRVGFLSINPRLPGILRKLQSIKYVRTITTSILYFATLLNEIRKYDVIHVFSASYLSFFIAPTPAILVSKLYGKKVLLNYHSGEAEDHLTRWRRSTIPIIKLVDQVTVPSDYLVRVFAKFGISAQAVFNFLELDQFPFRERMPVRPVFLSNRNLELHYGVDRVLRAFRIIQQQFPDATLTIVGDGSQRATLEKLEVNLGLQGTTFRGQIPHEKIYEAYQAADIFLNASEIDNQPLSILEAFACGLPVVSTDAGGIPDMVANGATGFIVSRGNYEALAQCAIRLLNDPGMACEIAHRAHKESLKYRWEVVCQKWLRQYHQMFSKRSEKMAEG